MQVLWIPDWGADGAWDRSVSEAGALGADGQGSCLRPGHRHLCLRLLVSQGSPGKRSHSSILSLPLPEMHRVYGLDCTDLYLGGFLRPGDCCQCWISFENLAGALSSMCMHEIAGVKGDQLVCSSDCDCCMLSGTRMSPGGKLHLSRWYESWAVSVLVLLQRSAYHLPCFVPGRDTAIASTAGEYDNELHPFASQV